MHTPRKTIFFDFHTMPKYPALGAEFNAEELADELARCGVDYTVFPARCNMGMAYYPTRIGIPHPTMQTDLLGQVVEACHKRGIAVGAYLNVGLSHEEGLLHREWTTVSEDGRAYEGPLLDHAFRKMCYNTGYADHLLAMIDELLERYPLDGLFFDCFTPHPCSGVECLREMRERGMDPVTFARFSRNRLLERIGEHIRLCGRDLLVYFNCVQYQDQRKVATYFEIECLPSGGWGYDFLPLYARYVRNLGKTVVNMAARFHESWGDFGGLRSRESLLFDVVTGLAHGLATDLADHLHPSGRLNRAVWDLFRSIYSEVTALEPWTAGAVAETDMVLMAGEDTMDNTLEAVPSIVAAQGLTRMLSELKCQFEVILPSDPIPTKRLLVIGDDIRFSEELAARIRAFLENGGRIIASGKAGWRQDAEQFALSAAWQAESAGESPYQPGYFQLCAAEPGIPGVPPMPIVIHQPGIRLRARGARVAAETVAPLANRHFDGEHAWLYLPPEQPDGFAFLTIGAQVAHIGAPLGTNYYHHAQIPLRQLLGMMVHQLLPDPLLKTDGLPAFARVTITRQGTRRILWVTAFLPEKRGEKMEIVEDTIEINHAVLLLRDPGCPPDRCYRLPDQSPVSWQREDDGYVRLTLPPFAGYCAIALEF